MIQQSHCWAYTPRKPEGKETGPEDLPYPGIEPGSPALQADSLPTELSGKLGDYSLHSNCHEGEQKQYLGLWCV